LQDPRDPNEPDAGQPAAQAPRSHPNDPLHGLTLQYVLTQLHARYGWAGLGREIQIRCFTHDPSMGSSLAFLRRQPWARSKVEALYLRSLEDAKASAPDAAAESDPAPAADDDS
jgi:uncharacterized protein (DUF2132 family)